MSDEIEIPWTGALAGDAEAQWLVDACDEWRVSIETPRFDPGWFHCSALGQTDEELIAQYRGVLAYPTFTARHLRVFDLGHDRDASIKRYMAEAGLSVVGEEEARSVAINHLRLRGTLDDIVRHPETGEWYVLEVKTINPFGYSRLTEPLESHMLQTHAYMAATQIDRCIILYEGKGDQAWRAFYREFDHELWAGIVKRLLRLRREAESMDAEVAPQIIDISRKLNAELAK